MENVVRGRLGRGTRGSFSPLTNDHSRGGPGDLSPLFLDFVTLCFVICALWSVPPEKFRDLVCFHTPFTHAEATAALQ